MRDKEDLIEIRSNLSRRYSIGKAMSLSVKGVKQGMEILGEAVLRKALRLGMCMGPGPKVK